MGDRVATLAWNGYRHLEPAHGVSGSGAVLHTINPRLHPDQIAYIVDHADDQVLFFDLTVIVALARRCTGAQGLGGAEHASMPRDSGIDTRPALDEDLRRAW